MLANCNRLFPVHEGYLGTGHQDEKKWTKSTAVGGDVILSYWSMYIVIRRIDEINPITNLLARLSDGHNGQFPYAAAPVSCLLGIKATLNVSSDAGKMARDSDNIKN